MKEQAEILIGKYRSKGAVIDTNLLLVYLVGCVDTSLIGRFKSTKSYCKDDFKALDDLFSKFNRVVTTPNIITETSNLGGQLQRSAKDKFFVMLANLILKTDETYIESSGICRDREFIQFGITDRGILELARSDHLVITDEFKLSQFCWKMGCSALNFNHIRQYLYP